MNLEAVKTKLHEHNFRLTIEREALLKGFMDSGQLFTPAELHAWVKDDDSKVGLTTVYRLLEVLTKLGLATPFLIDGDISYTFCSEQHHHHFICIDCRHVTDIYHCTESFFLGQDIGRVEHHRIDLFGHCKDCEAQQ